MCKDGLIGLAVAFVVVVGGSGFAQGEEGSRAAASGPTSPAVLGRVTDPQGMSLSGADVTARIPALGGTLTHLWLPASRTNPDGRFVLPIEFPGLKYFIDFQYSNDSTYQAALIPEQPAELNIVMPRKARHVLVGTVRGREGGPGVPGAAVHYFGEYHRFAVEVKTDDQGRWRIVIARETAQGWQPSYAYPSGDANLFSVGTEGGSGLAALVQNVQLTPPTKAVNLDIRLAPTATQKSKQSQR